MPGTDKLRSYNSTSMPIIHMKGAEGQGRKSNFQEDLSSTPFILHMAIPVTNYLSLTVPEVSLLLFSKDH